MQSTIWKVTMVWRTTVYLNKSRSWIWNVFASFVSVLKRISFSPRSIAPAKERARPLWCANSSCDQFRISRSVRTLLPTRFATASASCMRHYNDGILRVTSTLCRRTLYHRLDVKDGDRTPATLLSLWRPQDESVRMWHRHFAKG
jgi:hypothetical protein